MHKKEDISFSDIDGFEWDEGNASKNRLKHDVNTSECEEVFFNDPLLFFDDDAHSSAKERRYKVLGVNANGRKLSLAITVRSNKIRVIMARDQSRKERKLFKEDREKENI